MTRRLLVFTLIGSLGSGSLAFAGESLLQSGIRIAEEVARTPGRLPASASRTALAQPGGALTPRGTPVRAEALLGQEPGLAKSGMSRRTKILIYAAAGVGFALTAYTIDRHVVDLTPSSLGTRKD
jgi:hypothetical protein